jgi:hypothetical protein
MEAPERTLCRNCDLIPRDDPDPNKASLVSLDFIAKRLKGLSVLLQNHSENENSDQIFFRL